MIIRYTFFVLICIQYSLAAGISAQNLTVSLVEEGPAHTRYLQSPYTDQGYTAVCLQNGNFSSSMHETTYSGVSGFAVSPDNRFISVLKRGESNSYHVNVLNSDGSVYMKHEDVIILDSNDPSKRIFAHNDGSFTIRDNIAGFTLFNPGGEETARLFNSSSDGEIHNPMIYAIDTDARSMKSEELARSIFMDHEKLEIELHQDGDRSWMLLGLNSPVRINI